MDEGGIVDYCRRSVGLTCVLQKKCPAIKERDMQKDYFHYFRIIASLVDEKEGNFLKGKRTNI
jgi:hypothetical protein